MNKVLISLVGSLVIAGVLACDNVDKTLQSDEEGSPGTGGVRAVGSDAGGSGQGTGGSRSAAGGSTGDSGVAEAGPKADASASIQADSSAPAADAAPDSDAAPDGASTLAPAGSPVAQHGVLSAKGNRVLDEKGEPVQLKGMSLYWSDVPEAAQFFNRDLVSWLAKDWKASVIRAAIAVREDSPDQGDYLKKPEEQLKLLDEVVQGAWSEGIYVIIDWHAHVRYLDQAKTFFDTASARYGKKANVIYEVWNEPPDTNYSWSDIKTYAEAVAKEIRKHDTKNLIVVGSAYWSQRPQEAVGNVVNDTNVAYSFHFYAGSPYHSFGGELGRNAQSALSGGLPLFATEWGTTDPDNQNFNESETRTWLGFFDKNAVSYCNWSITGVNEASSAVKPTANPKGGWADGDLTASGALVRKLIRGN